MYSAALPVMQTVFYIWESFYHKKERHQGFHPDAALNSLDSYRQLPKRQLAAILIYLLYAKHHAQNAAEELGTLNNDYLHKNRPFCI